VSPALIESSKRSQTLYHERLSALFRLLMGISLAIAIPITFVSGFLARVAYGAGYEGVGTILAIHIWSAPFVFLGVAQSPWSINEGLTRLTLFRTICAALTNVFLNLLLIPRFGAAGAAIATTISYALAAVFLNAFSRRTRGIFFLQLNSMFMLPPRK
jgi:PST family polysaccharide transporter